MSCIAEFGVCIRANHKVSWIRDWQGELIGAWCDTCKKNV